MNARLAKELSIARNICFDDFMDIKEEIEKLKERNKKVESDKAWELSKTRRIIVAFSIYLAAYVLFWMINTPKPLVDASVPALAYILSTLTFPFFKKWWIYNLYKR